jgi:predicted AAA+ superfamily ATPase
MSDIGYKLENAVAAKLRQKYTDIFYYSNKFEVDFLIATHNSILFYNIADNIDDVDTARREITSLEKGLKSFPSTKAYLILKEQTERKITAPIEVVPIIEFLLED